MTHADKQLPGVHRGEELLAQVQGWFYAITGVWPLVSGDTFQKVTGYKVDFWLAQTVGILLCISGIVLIRAGLKRRVTGEIILLASLQAAALAAVDVYCVWQPNTTRVYLLDAVAETALVAIWMALRFRRSRPDGL